MSEIIDDKRIYSLLEVTRSIQKTLSDRYTSAFWVKAEMNKLNHYKHSGHCYPELVEKNEGKVIAQMKSILWKDDYVLINNKFLTVLKEPLKDGIKILFLARITFDSSHGLALRMVDIDPAYTLGDLEKEKQDTIKRMITEGIFNKNKSLSLPLLPKRIAIISVETSKGFADFIKVIDNNNWNYTFFHMLFPALLQGEKAIGSIIRQLKRIKKVQHHFDVVAIIRGGGGDVGLSSFNHYDLAKEVALFPIPVITGIGHATNETVVEMISFSNAITPTKIAEYLLQQFHNFAVPVQKAEERIIDRSKRLLHEQQTKLTSEVKLFRSVTENIVTENQSSLREQYHLLMRQIKSLFRNKKEMLIHAPLAIRNKTIQQCQAAQLKMDYLKTLIKRDVNAQVTHHKIKLQTAEKNIENMSPESVLKRGYSLTLHQGKFIKKSDDVKAGDTIETVVYGGRIQSIVQTSERDAEHEQ